MVDEVLGVGLCMDNGIHYFLNTDNPDPLRIFVGRVPRHSLGFTTKYAFVNEHPSPPRLLTHLFCDQIPPGAE